MNEMIKEQIDKVMSYKSIKSKQKIDRLLEINAIQYTNTGTDSTKTEMNIAENTSKYIYRKIKQLDAKLGDMLLRT
tara:strand:+ start:790 stop:1017 length:228 start_codon:yes stop_codon:yes gene_type:complete